jgi:hypothetical protein
MKKIITAVTLIFLVSLNIYGQELNATVTINYEQLPVKYKEHLRNFTNEVQTYLNTNQFSGGSWEWARINCNFNIFFTGAGGETNYNAQVVITSTRPIEGMETSTLMLSALDNTWSFEYEVGQPMYYAQTDFDPLTSFLDFYAFLIIGLDSDSYEAFAGNDYFNEALRIAVLGASSPFSDGWIVKTANYNKRAMVEDLLNSTYTQFRKDFTDYHYNGLDLYYQNKAQTYKSMEKLINNLAKLRKTLNKRSVLINTFFEAKHKEIIKYMLELDDRSIFETLKTVDPPRLSKYIEAAES